MLLDRQLGAQVRVRVGSAVLAGGLGDRAELLARRAVLLHVALGDHRVAGRGAEPAVDGVVAPAALVRLARPGARVVGGRDQRDLALAGLDRHRGVADQARVGRAALVPHAADPRLQAHRLRDLLAEHALEARRRVLDHHRVDGVLLDAGVRERVARRLDGQRQRSAARQLAVRRVPDPRDDGFASHHTTSSRSSASRSSRLSPSQPQKTSSLCSPSPGLGIRSAPVSPGSSP